MLISTSSFPAFQQHDSSDCGPTCLRIIAKHYGKSLSLPFLRSLASLGRFGVSLLNISEAAEKLGFRSRGVRLSFANLRQLQLPCIVHWKQEHFLVVYKIDDSFVYVSDPAVGLLKYSHQEFINAWSQTVREGQPVGIALLLEPTPELYEQIDIHSKSSFTFLFSYLKPYRKLIIQLGLGLLAGSCIQLFLPLMSQALVDFGVSNQDLNFVYIILLAQFVMHISQASVSFMRSWILLHLSTRINISIVSDFLIKLMRLPIRFFDSKSLGDLLQRVEDHSRIESFLTSGALNALFSAVSIVVFSLLLCLYSWKIFLIFALFSVLSSGWVMLFLGRRRELDYKQFQEASRNQSALIQIFKGMPEIKLNGCEKQQRWDWEKTQIRLFKISSKSLALEQSQQSGSLLLDNIRDILVSFMAARLVITGDISLGMMFAIQAVLGQLHLPIHQLVEFVIKGQDAKISLERMGEVHVERPEEENSAIEGFEPESISSGDVSIEHLTFKYPGSEQIILDDICLSIPRGKITAVVGVSGSGKTTLLKMLLKFYQPQSGAIKVHGVDLKNIPAGYWRSNCGVVMQDGILFADSVARNIALSADDIDYKRVREVARICCIDEYIEALPHRYQTRLGDDGFTTSQGQRQRLLIARALYNDPEFILFDEATSSLDANNERAIIENLAFVCQGKTVFVIAHRLSTVKHADQIVVLSGGKIVEFGTHSTLVSNKGAYFELIKNQLELGS